MFFCVPLLREGHFPSLIYHPLHGIHPISGSHKKKKQTPKNLAIYHVKNLLDREIHTTVVIQFSRFRFAHVRRGKEVIRPTNCRHRPRWESVGAFNRVEFPEMPLARICFVFKARQGNENFSKPKGKKKTGERAKGRRKRELARAKVSVPSNGGRGYGGFERFRFRRHWEDLSRRKGLIFWNFSFFRDEFWCFLCLDWFFFFFWGFSVVFGGLVWVFIFGILWLILGNLDALERIFALFDFLFELSWWLRLWESNWGFFSPVSFEVFFYYLFILVSVLILEFWGIWSGFLWFFTSHFRRAKYWGFEDKKAWIEVFFFP